MLSIKYFDKVLACVYTALIVVAVVLGVVGTVQATVVRIAVSNIHLPVIVRCPSSTVGGFLVHIIFPTFSWSRGWR